MELKSNDIDEWNEIRYLWCSTFMLALSSAGSLMSLIARCGGEKKKLEHCRHLVTLGRILVFYRPPTRFSYIIVSYDVCPLRHDSVIVVRRRVNKLFVKSNYWADCWDEVEGKNRLEMYYFKLDAFELYQEFLGRLQSRRFVIAFQRSAIDLLG